MAKDEYMIVSDDDGHDFIIPADDEAEWDKLETQFYNDEEVNFPPDWAVEVGGSLRLIKFTSYRIE